MLETIDREFGSVLTRDKILKLIYSGELEIEPFNEKLVRENGIDLRVGEYFALPAESVTDFVNREIARLNKQVEFIDKVRVEINDLAVKLDELDKVKIESLYCKYKVSDYIYIPPKCFALIVTKEYVKLPSNVVGFCNLRSSFARLGLIIPPTIVDAGFEGQLVIEIYNTRNIPIAIRVETPFLHLVLVKASGRAEYSGKYQRQIGVKLPEPEKFKPIE